MSVYFESDEATVHHGDCLDILATLPDASVDAVVTDPPYGLEFMGRGWDAPWQQADINTDAGFHGGGISATKGLPSFTSTTNPKCLVCKGTRRGRRDGTAKVAVCLCVDGGRFPNVRAVEMRAFQEWVEQWAIECLRVLKPGGHMLAFGGSRTWHRLAAGIEDAGFEIRDSIAWLYGSGFPKSMDVAKAIDKARDDRGAVVELTSRLADLADAAGITRADVDERMGTSDMGGWWLSRLAHRAAVPAPENWRHLRDVIPGAAALDGAVEALNRRKGEWGNERPDRVVGDRGANRVLSPTQRVTAPGAAVLDEARAWEGWGTALKPAFEPIVVARKPLAGTVAANVLAHGTGALNIDATRIAGEPDVPGSTPATANGNGVTHGSMMRAPYVAPAGRFPANVVLDESQAAVLDEQAGVLTSGKMQPTQTTAARSVYGQNAEGGFTTMETYGDSGGASRFFYTAKASGAERPNVGGVQHPTVKPIDLMRWLVRLVTPRGGIVLEPFAGSGTTVEAAVSEGFRCIAVEREAEYLPLIAQRLDKPIEQAMDIFGGAA